MDTVDRDVLVSLSAHKGWPAVSLYLPTHRVGDKGQDRIRLKNLLRSACDRLVADGMRSTEAEAFCGPLRDTLADDGYWRDIGDGLVVFMSAEGTWTLRLDVSVDEQAIVGDRFYLRPLLAAQRGGRHFYALAVSRNGCRLYKGDGALIDQVPLEGIPESIADEMRYDVREESLQYTSFAGQQATAGAGEAIGQFHGHGGEKDVDKVALERYLRKVEGAVSGIVACDAGIPLLLMGVEYELSMYRLLSDCSALVPEQVTGSPERMTPHQIRLAALEALADRFDDTVKAELAELTEKEGSSLTSHDAVEIVAAAAAGRIKTIFLDNSMGPYGVFNRETFSVASMCATEPRLLRETETPMEAGADCGWDLVDLAAAETTLHGGEVHAFAGEEAPIHGVAAVFRY